MKILINNNFLKLVEIVKGIDFDILKKLNEDKLNYLVLRTIKELEIVSKIHEDFKIESFQNFLNKLNHENFNEGDLKKEVSSFIEFGKNFESLNNAEKTKCLEFEILQELNHFSRIMFFDEALTANEDEEITWEKALRLSNDFMRFLMLVNERKKFRDKEGKEILPVNPFYSLSGNIKEVKVGNFKFCLLSLKNENLNLYLILTSENLNLTLRDFTLVLDKIFKKLPYRESFLLFDYFVFLISEFREEFKDINISLCLLRENLINNKKILEIIKIGNPSLSLILFNYALEIKDFNVLNFALQQNYLGKILNDFYFEKIFLNNFNRAFIFLDKASEILQKLPQDELKNIINKKDELGRLNVLNNFQKLMTNNKVESYILTLNLGNIKKLEKRINVTIVDYEEKVKEKLSSILSMSSSKIISIEAGHIHADRDYDENQLLSLKLALVVENLLKKHGFETEKFIMIDEYHVVNRFNYKNYLEELNKIGYRPFKLIFESSPIILEISIDLLKFILENFKDKVFIKGRNIYFKLNENKFIELVEDFKNRFIIGCVLYDAGLVCYKIFKEEMNKIFNKVNNFEKGFDIHSEMLNIYLQFTEPEERLKKVKQLYNKIFSIKKVEDEIRNKPYSDFIFSQTDRSKILLNVLEFFYRPQQEKLNLFLSHLNLPPIYSLYFDLLGNLTLGYFYEGQIIYN